MSSFRREWLALREPADAAARSSHLAALIARELTGRAAVVHILDLGTGTGANMRYLAGRLPRPQEWLLVDKDPHLLAAASHSGGSDASWRSECVDLASGLATHPTLFANRELVTASALLDLVSGTWMDRLAADCRECGAAILFALTYDGRIECWPAEPEDAAVRSWVNLHQQTDKGFGAALGPQANNEAAKAFERLGYQIARQDSDWVLGPDDCELQRQLIAEWAAAAIEVAPDRASAIEMWKGRRNDHVKQGRSRLVVGHQDLAGWPVK
jgi:hypothetical protein